jgi:gamma-glutamylaminecyclotransferase
MTHRVFVYGTLKRGFCNHRLLEGCEFLGSAATVPAYRMIETGFPVIMPDPEGKPVSGEVYAVDDKTLERLDRQEREGLSYDRRLIDVTLPLAGGRRLPSTAFIYVGREDRFGTAFARGPLYDAVNDRGELDWKSALSNGSSGDDEDDHDDKAQGN